MMNAQRMAAAAAKLATKVAWSAWSAAAPAPRIESLHQRRLVDEVRSNDIGMPYGSLEFVKRATGRLYIEPDWGYLIGANGHLIEESTAPNFEYAIPPWRLAMPSPVGFARARQGRTPTVHHRSVISLRHPWEWNYFHFYHDVLGRLRLFDEVGIDQSTPLVLGRYAIELPFVRQIIDRGALKDRNWIIQDHTYVVADEVYYCRTKQQRKPKADYLLDLMGVPARRDEVNERVFLTRGQNVARHIVNMDEIEGTLREHGFRIVDVAGWTIDQQIELFSGTRYLVAIHGAGLTNMMFRRDSALSVLELHAETYRSLDFEAVCEEFGYAWDHLSGPPDSPNGGQHDNFSLDPVLLDEKIRQMLSAGEPLHPA
jgi:hypothetical protein